MNDSPFKPAQNAEPAQWLVERLATFGADVSSIVPSGFEAYARVFHPAEKVVYGSEDPMSWVIEPICWTEVAEFTGRTPHGAVQWASLRGETPSIHDEAVLQAGDVWVREPEIGSLPLSVTRALWLVLEPHTKTREACFFAVWEGFGCLPRTVLDAPAFEIPARKLHLFTGPLEAVEGTFCTNDPRRAQAMSVDVVVVTGPDTPSPEELEEALKTYVRPAFPADQQSANL